MAYLNRIIGLLGGPHIEAHITVVGLRNSGKSTLLRQLKPHQIKMMHMTPSLPVGYRCERFQYRSLILTAFDLDELSGFGNPWEDYYKECDAVIFVVDASDRYSIDTVRQQVQRVLSHPGLVSRKVPILVLANKGDQPGALPAVQMVDALSLRAITSKPWTVFCTDCLTGEGLHESLDWLAHQLRSVCRKRCQSF